MLDDLRQRATAILSAASDATLITCGPAELQAAIVRCEAHGLQLYALVSQMSDLLFNLEQRPEVLVFTAQWQLRGLAQQLAAERYPAGLRLLQTSEAAWSVLVLIRPIRLHWIGNGSSDTAETIDLQRAGA